METATSGTRPATALATVTDTTTKAETVPPLAYTLAPVSLLRAALACTTKSEERYYLSGVYLHSHEGKLRIAATDGSRMLVASFAPPAPYSKLPSWLEKGLIVAGEGLKAKLALIDSSDPGDSPLARIGYATRQAKASLEDVGGDLTMKCAIIDGQFPDYDRVIAGSRATFEGGERAPLDSASFATAKMKGVGEIGTMLGAAAVHVIQAANPTDPSVVTFDEVPGVALYLMPFTAGAAVAPETAAIIAPGLRGSIAALKAHKTRAEADAKRAKDPRDKAAAEARVTSYNARISAILIGTGKQLPPPPAAVTKVPPVQTKPVDVPPGAKPAAKPGEKPAAKSEAKAAPKLAVVARGVRIAKSTVNGTGPHRAA
ncbi:MAG: hypothetical protein ACREEN_00365 [Stellaceae bacterium]